MSHLTLSLLQHTHPPYWHSWRNQKLTNIIFLTHVYGLGIVYCKIRLCRFTFNFNFFKFIVLFFFIMLDHNKSYALAYTPARLIYWNIVYNGMLLSGYKLLTVCIQVICLSMSISNFRQTVCCKVILFPASGLPLSMKRYGGRLAHLRRSVTASLRRWVAIRLSVSGTASCCPHHTTFVTDLRHPLSTCQQLTAV